MLLRTLLLNVSFHSSDLEIQLSTYKHKSSPRRALSELFSGLCTLKTCIKLLKLAYFLGLFSVSTGCSKSWEICSLTHLAFTHLVSISVTCWEVKSTVPCFLLENLNFLTGWLFMQKCWKYHRTVFGLFNRYDRNIIIFGIIKCADVKISAEPLLYYF